MTGAVAALQDSKDIISEPHFELGIVQLIVPFPPLTQLKWCVVEGNIIVSIYGTCKHTFGTICGSPK